MYDIELSKVKMCHPTTPEDSWACDFIEEWIIKLWTRNNMYDIV